MMRRALAALAAAAIAGCSGAGTPSSVPMVPHVNVEAKVTGRATLTFSLRIPRHRRAHYISSSTKSIVIAAQASGGTVVRAFANTTPSSPNCAGTLLALTCTVNLHLRSNTYTVAIATYDATQTNAATPAGHLLSSNSVFASVRKGKNTTIRAVLNAVPATVTVSAAAAQTNVEGNDGSGLTTLGGSRATILVAAYDIDGNVIVGGGAPALSIVVNSATGGITTAHSTTNLNAFSLSSTGVGSASLTATAKPATGNAASVTFNVTAVTTTTFLAGVLSSPGHGDGTGSGATFYFPTGLVYNSDDGAIYVVDSFNCTIRKMTTGGVVTTVAGTAGHCDSASGDLNHPVAAVYDPDDKYLYVADEANCTVDAVPLTTGTFSRIAGTAGACDGTGSDLKNPEGITYAGNQTLYLSDTNNCVVRKIASIDTTAVVTTFAGTVGTCDDVGTDFKTPTGIVYDGTGTLYVADEVNCNIRKIVISGVVQSTLAGTTTCNGIDGTGSNAGFAEPFALAYDANHSVLYVTDMGVEEIRQVTTAGVVTTLAGKGKTGYQEGSLLQSAMMASPEGVVYLPGAAGALGSVYFSDTSNQLVRRLNR